jgi:hypothetical protein
MTKKEIEHTSTTLGNQDMKGSQRMVSVVEPYELPEGWEWMRQRYSHTDWTLLRKV